MDFNTNKMSLGLLSIFALFSQLRFTLGQGGEIRVQIYSRANAVGYDERVYESKGDKGRCAEKCVNEGCKGFLMNHTTVEGEQTSKCVIYAPQADLPADTGDVYLRPECTPPQGTIKFLRRTDGSENFNRLWADYKSGFGDAQGEFWLGLETLHAVTAAQNYGLWVCMKDENSRIYATKYSDFSIGQEADNYRLSVSGYDALSTAGDSITDNPSITNVIDANPKFIDGMEFSTPDNDNDLSPGSCAVDYGAGWWLNQCSTTVPTGPYGSVVSWYTAKTSLDPFPFMELGIFPGVSTTTEPCPKPTGAISFLRRIDGSENFNRLWADYKSGFGDPLVEFWMGLDTLNSLTSSQRYGLWVCMEDNNNDWYMSQYSDFSVGPETDNYRLNVTGYDVTSTAGDSITDNPTIENILNSDPKFIHGMEFTTPDRDNDPSGGNCGDSYSLGWWLNMCGVCVPTGGYGSIVVWYTGQGNLDPWPYIEFAIVPK